MSVRRGHAGKVDGNHAEIVAAFRACGWSVTSLAQVGAGCPDLVVGRAGRNLLVEVKRPKAVLTPDETAWHAAWRGQVCIVRTVADVIALSG
ncbi:MAG TPA: hypothetical protein VFO31_04395 [Vicinamibacterales bacterium]|nr:hypothetical protein [Vicinamibacterales bacterium]